MGGNLGSGNSTVLRAPKFHRLQPVSLCITPGQRAPVEGIGTQVGALDRSEIYVDLTFGVRFLAESGIQTSRSGDGPESRSNDGPEKIATDSEPRSTLARHCVSAAWPGEGKRSVRLISHGGPEAALTILSS